MAFVETMSFSAQSVAIDGHHVIGGNNELLSSIGCHRRSSRHSWNHSISQRQRTRKVCHYHWSASLRTRPPCHLSLRVMLDVGLQALEMCHRHSGLLLTLFPLVPLEHIALQVRPATVCPVGSHEIDKNIP